MPKSIRCLAGLVCPFVACLVDSPDTERGFARYIEDPTGNETIDAEVTMEVLENYCNTEVYTPEDMEYCLEPSGFGPGFTDSWDEFEPSLLGYDDSYGDSYDDSYDDPYADPDDPYADSWDDSSDGYYPYYGAVRIRKVHNYVVAMGPAMVVVLGIAAVATAPIEGAAVGSLILAGAAVLAIRGIATTYDKWGPGLVQVLRSDSVPTAKDESISGSLARAVERDQTRTNQIRCPRPSPRTVRPGGTVPITFCAIPGQPLLSDTSAITVLGAAPGTRVNVAVRAIGIVDVAAVLEFQTSWDRTPVQLDSIFHVPGTLPVVIQPGRIKQIQGFSAQTQPMFSYIPIAAN